jgi:hypothetical protein
MQLYYFYPKQPATSLNHYVILSESVEAARNALVHDAGVKNIMEFSVEIYPANTIIKI